MERKVILKMVVDNLKKAELKGGVTELLLEPKQPGNKRRSIFFADTDKEGASQIHWDIFYSELTMQHFEPELQFYENLDELGKSTFLPLNLNKLENNWRGRLFRADATSLSDETRIRKSLLESTWRVIITRDSEENFYVRHDIYPAFYLPGFSVAGFPQFKDSLASSIDAIIRNDGRLVDKDFDTIKFFGKGANSNHFQPIPIARAQDSVKAAELLDSEERTRIMKAAIVGYNNYFTER